MQQGTQDIGNSVPSGMLAFLPLLQRPQIPWMWGKKQVELGPEEKLSVEVADELRELTLHGVYQGIWHHTPNEGKRSRLTGIITRAMGMIPGVADFSFMWGKEGRGYIELKAGKNSQNPNQKLFQQWCEGHGIPYAICRSLDEVLATLRKWGAL